jgi:hypothetical protein
MSQREVKPPVTSFNGWMLGKIVTYMGTKEGCDVERVEYTNDGARAIIRDTFGYRYEINIETLSRVYDGDPSASPSFALNDDVLSGKSGTWS